MLLHYNINSVCNHGYLCVTLLKNIYYWYCYWRFIKIFFYQNGFSHTLCKSLRHLHSV